VKQCVEVDKEMLATSEGHWRGEGHTYQFEVDKEARVFPSFGQIRE